MRRTHHRNWGWIITVAVAVAGLSLAGAANAAVVVHWDGGDHGGSGGTPGSTRDFARTPIITTGDFDNDSNADDSQLVVPFSITEPLNPAFDPPHYNDANSAVFYGGHQFTFLNQTSLLSYQLRYHHGRYLQMRFSSQQNVSMANVLVWDKANFLNGGDNEVLGLDATSSLSFDKGNGVNNADLRFLVRTAQNQYYLSQTTASSPSTFTLDGSDLLNEMWALYDPTSSIVFDSLNAQFNVSTALLTDITGFGVYATAAHTSTAKAFALHSFIVNAAVIPEPGTVALLAAGLGLIAPRRRGRG